METQGLFFCVLAHFFMWCLSSHFSSFTYSYCLPCIWWFNLKILCFPYGIFTLYHSIHSLFVCVYLLTSFKSAYQVLLFQVTFSNFFFSPERNFLWIHNFKVSTSIFSCYCCSVTKLCLTLCDPMNCSMSGFPVSLSPRVCSLMSIESVMPSSHLILCHPLLFLPSVFPSIRIFSKESAFCIQCQSIETSASVLPMNIQCWFPLGLTGLISCCPRDFKSLLQYHNSKAWILWHSAFFMVQQQYMTTGKTIALTIQTFVGKVMSLLFNMLSRLVIAFLPRSKCLLISWLQVIVHSGFEAQENKSLTLLPLFPHLPWSDGTGCHDLSFLNAEF